MGSLAHTSTADGDDIASIVVELQNDPMAAANRLLALGAEADQDPQLIHALLNTARAVGRQGDWKKSISLLVRAHAVQHAKVKSTAAPGEESLVFLHTIDLAIASAGMQCDDFERTTVHCQHVISDSDAPAQHRAAAYPLLVKAYRSSSRLDEASRTLHQAAIEKPRTLAADVLAELALMLGSDCLQQKNAAAAKLAYEDYLTLTPQGPRVADAKLGAAWAAALGAEPAEEAANKLVEFVNQYPQHRDAPHALRASATCLDQAGQTDRAEATRGRLLESFPHSSASIALLEKYGSTEAAWPATARTAWRVRMSSADKTSLSITTDQAAAVFAESLRSSDNVLWQSAVRWLAQTDRDGLRTEAVLRRFASQDQESLAEHLAVDLIAQVDEESSSGSSAAAESACRWAGASERWTMLALAATELGLPSESSHRSINIDRLLAESLMQTQQPVEAMRWWDWLIDKRGADDFSTLLRGAETSVAHGNLETASTRVESARAAAGNDAFRLALTRILAAELSIRRARFDEARESLAEVVRENDVAPVLRPRAQWMIGETHFLQQQYAEAIDAYRRVDAMDSAGEWAPAALLQAGKAFEKLGRGRDAAVCYTALLTRFHDWPHANAAQSRLATLNPSTSEQAPVLR